MKEEKEVIVIPDVKREKKINPFTPQIQPKSIPKAYETYL